MTLCDQLSLEKLHELDGVGMLVKKKKACERFWRSLRQLGILYSASTIRS